MLIICLQWVMIINKRVILSKSAILASLHVDRVSCVWQQMYIEYLMIWWSCFSERNGNLETFQQPPVFHFEEISSYSHVTCSATHSPAILCHYSSIINRHIFRGHLYVHSPALRLGSMHTKSMRGRLVHNLHHLYILAIRDTVSAFPNDIKLA